MQLKARRIVPMLFFIFIIFSLSSFTTVYLLSDKDGKQGENRKIKDFKDFMFAERYEEARDVLKEIINKASEEDKKLLIDAMILKGNELFGRFPGEKNEDKYLVCVKAYKQFLSGIDSYNVMIDTNGPELRTVRSEMGKQIENIYDIYLDKFHELKTAQKFDEAVSLLERFSESYGEDKILKDKIMQCALEKKYNEELVLFEGEVEHIFFHPLIAYTELAFDNDYQALGYDDWFVTVKEFKKIIESLYKNQFILVDINTIFEEVDVNGSRALKKKKLLLPKGKKPLIISIDDLNYYDYMIKNGNVHKLVLDGKGEIATLTNKPSGEKLLSKDNEIVPILDEFVKEHGDFSFKGAKGVIALTGYEGVLGYRTEKLTSPSFENEKNEALKVIKRLKETGWTFASHSYGHPSIPKVSYERVVYDTNKWKKEVESLIGPTSIYIYPYGSAVEPSDPKYKFLVDSGFKMLCAVGPRPYFKVSNNAIMMDRRHIDGISLRHQGSSLIDFFDAKEVFDDVRPKR